MRSWLVVGVAVLALFAAGGLAAGVVLYEPVAPIPGHEGLAVEEWPVGAEEWRWQVSSVASAVWVDSDVPGVPFLEGVVTSLPCPSEVGHGDVVLAVDGVDRVGWLSEEPFFRRLSVGDVGGDVAALRDGLGRLGFDVGETARRDRFDRSLRGAVREFSVSLGAARSDVFDPAWVIWLDDDARIGGCLVKVGSLISGGVDVFESPRLLASLRVPVTVTPPDEVDVSVAVVGSPESAPVSFEADGRSVVVSDLVSSLLEGAGVAESYEVVFEAVEPIDVAVVPPSALLVDGSVLCVFVDRSGVIESVVVEVVDSELGSSVVVPVDDVELRSVLRPGVAAAELAGVAGCG